MLISPLIALLGYYELLTINALVVKTRSYGIPVVLTLTHYFILLGFAGFLFGIISKRIAWRKFLITIS